MRGSKTYTWRWGSEGLAHFVVSDSRGDGKKFRLLKIYSGFED